MKAVHVCSLITILFHDVLNEAGNGGNKFRLNPYYSKLVYETASLHERNKFIEEIKADFRNETFRRIVYRVLAKYSTRFRSNRSKKNHQTYVENSFPISWHIITPLNNFPRQTTN